MFEPILAALERASVRYVVVGGVATVLHGYARLTADLDLAIDLEGNRPAAAVEALTSLGLLPLLPVSAESFANPDLRRSWVEDRNLKVFSFHDPANPMVQVDLFAENPIPFEDLWDRSVRVKLGSQLARIAGIDDLIAMKRAAGRPQDLSDIEALEIIAERGKA